MARTTARKQHIDVGHMTQGDIAMVFGVSRPAVAQWDCPRNKDGSYSAPLVAAWREEQAREAARREAPPSTKVEASARERKLNAEADIMELKLARELEQVVLREDVDQFIGHAGAQFISAVQSLIKTLPFKLEGLEVKEIQKVIEMDLTSAIETVRREYEPST